MTRTCVTLCACALLLGGCMSSSKPAVIHHYTLGAATAIHDPQPASHAAKSLQVARITVPSWLAGDAMYYRLDYRHDNQLAAYGYADWVAPPVSLLEPIIQGACAATGAWQAVVGPRDPVVADVSLHLRIDDFSQAFTAAGQSAAVIQGTATLIDNHDNRVLAQEPVRVRVAAATPDAEGGAAALAAASRQLAAQLARWAATALPADGP